MEYEDFLSYWEAIERTQLFDPSWVQSSHWLEVKSRPMPCAWQYGDVSCEFRLCRLQRTFYLEYAFQSDLTDPLSYLLTEQVTFTLPKASETIIVLSQSDNRYFRDLAGASTWSFDFKLFKHGDDEPLASSSFSYSLTRSGSLHIDLEPGEYVVHVRLDRDIDQEKVSLEALLHVKRCMGIHEVENEISNSLSMGGSLPSTRESCRELWVKLHVASLLRRTSTPSK